MSGQKKDQVKYYKCISGGVTGISVGDVRKAWEEDGVWWMEDLYCPASPWRFDEHRKQVRGLCCYFKEVYEEEGDDPVYLKCVSVVDNTDYLTVGEVYQSIKVHDGCELYKFTADNGKEVYENILSGFHGKFEIVESPQEHTKLTPRSLGCFQEVADVIGEKAAEVELQKVIDYDTQDLIGDDLGKTLLGCFVWDLAPQGNGFWSTIDDGEVPTGYTLPITAETQEQPKQSPESQPKFGDVLHINGVHHVFIQVDEDGDYMATDDSGNSVFVDLSDFDEYKPNETQELRNRILTRWQGQSLDTAYDTILCRANVSVGEIVEFVIQNIEEEEGE